MHTKSFICPKLWVVPQGKRRRLYLIMATKLPQNEENDCKNKRCMIYKKSQYVDKKPSQKRHIQEKSLTIWENVPLAKELGVFSCLGTRKPCRNIMNNKLFVKLCSFSKVNQPFGEWLCDRNEWVSKILYPCAWNVWKGILDAKWVVLLWSRNLLPTEWLATILKNYSLTKANDCER